MTRTIAERVGFIHEIERRLSGLDPETPDWLDAQRMVVRARADYWTAMGEDWDRHHPFRPDADRTGWRW
jgi:hypothetical protein